MSEQHWLYRPGSVRVLWGVFIAILVATLVAGLFIHPHGYFGIDATFGFFAWFGFLVCVLQILAAKLLAIFLKRRDTYYHD